MERAHAKKSSNAQAVLDELCVFSRNCRMKAVKILFTLVAALAIVVLGFYAYLGGLSTVQVTRGEMASMEIVYSLHRGAYKDLHKSWSRFKGEWESAGLKECDALAVYLDPPGTPDEKLRSVIACRVDSLSREEKEKVKGKLPSFVIPRSLALLSSFPYRNPASYFVGPSKVYPAFQRELTADNITPPAAIETYGSMSKPAEQIGFAMPLESKRSDYAKLVEAF